MNRLRTSTLVAAACLSSLASTVVAQTLPDANATPVMALREAVTVAPATDGAGVQAAGWDYRATVDATGLTFVPALGAAADRTEQLRLDILDFGRSVTRRAAPATPRVTGTTIECDRGDSAVERFAATPEGVALSWRFEAPVPGGGDLVVRYRLTTSLPNVELGPNGLVASLDGVGGVTIGGVTGIDASGRRVAGELRFDEGVLEMRLPAAFVDEASYPLVLDPLIGTQLLASSNSWNDSEPDVAYDATNDVYLVVYRRVFSAVSMALRGQRIDGSGALVGGFVVVTSGTVQVKGPSIANIANRDSFVVAWQQAASPFSPWAIFCCSVDASNGAVSSPVSLIPNLFGEALDPGVAGNRSATGSSALVVYHLVGQGIRLARVALASPGAAPQVGNTAVVTASALASAPAISRTGSDRYHLVCYRQGVIGATQLAARVCSTAGSLAGSGVVVVNAPLGSGSLGSCAVDGDGTQFVVAYERGEVAAPAGERDVWCRALRWTAATMTLANSSAETALQNVAGLDSRDPAVGFCRDKFVVLHGHQVFPGASNYDVRGHELAFDCSPCGQPIVLTGVNSTVLRNVESAPAIASEFGGGATASDRALIVFHEADDAPPFEGSIIAQRYEALGGGAFTYGGSPCGTPGAIAPSGGPYAVGNTRFGIELAGAPAGAVPILMFAFPGPPQSCAACSVVNPVASVFVPAINGTARYPWSLPCSVAPFVGAVFEVQWAVLTPGVSPCALAPDISFTRRLGLDLDF